MKADYLKWVTKNVAKEYKEFYRDGIKRLYTQDPLNNSYECTFTTESGETLSEDMVAEEALSLIYDAIKAGVRFGDLDVEHTETGDGTEFSKKYGVTRLILPVGEREVRE